MNCKSCGQPLIEIEFNTHYRLVCNNDKCKVSFREGQGNRAKELKDIPEESKTNNGLYILSPSRLRAGYAASLEERKQIDREQLIQNAEELKKQL